jgi:5-methylthioadenosine/S-adenosylhomocysteine deaminase
VGERGGMIVWALSPGSPQRCSPELLQRVAALASECDLPIFTHVYESRAQRLFSEDNYKDYAGSIFRYMSANGVLGPRVTIAHGVWPASEEIEYLADTGTGIVLNMLSNLRLRNGVPPISAYRRLGIPLSLGSDNCTCSDVQSIFQVMKLYCLLGGIMEPDVEPPSAAEALRLATIGGANRAGIDNRIGAIEPGMKADLVALDLADPAFRPLHSVARQLVYSESGRSVRHVWVEGKQVVCNGSSLLVNEGRLLEELSNVMPELRRTIDRLSTEAKCFGSVSAELHNAAWSRPLPYNRFLSAS